MPSETPVPQIAPAKNLLRFSSFICPGLCCVVLALSPAVSADQYLRSLDSEAARVETSKPATAASGKKQARSAVVDPYLSALEDEAGGLEAHETRGQEKKSRVKFRGLQY